MTINSKSIVVSILSVCLLGAPFASQAATTTPLKVKDRSLFCDKIDEVSDKMMERLDKMTGNVSSKKADRMKKITDARTKRDSTRTTNRSERTTKRETAFTTLNEKADTDVKKAAVTKFENTMNAAINTRKAAVDASVATYRSGVDELIATKIPSIDTNLATFKTSVSSALTTAKNSCDANTSDTVVKNVLMASIKSAQDKMKADRTDAKIKTDIDELVSARKAATQKALDDFKNTAESARAELKTAFGVK